MQKPSSRAWLKEHFNDPFVKKAKQMGYRSRAVFKLLELNDRDQLFKPGMVIVELGAAPGGWSQVLSQLVGERGQVLAVDLLPMDPIEGVHFIQGNVEEPAVLEQVKAYLGQRRCDWVISDMAPNMSGNESIDVPRSIYLAELALDFALEELSPQGSLLLKILQGSGFDAFLTQLKTRFERVLIRKPKASRGRSREIYLIARSLK